MDKFLYLKNDFCIRILKHKSLQHFRVVDYTFGTLAHIAKANEFLTTLNCLHSSLKITFEKEEDMRPPFPNVCVARTDISFETSAYSKSIFTGKYLLWGSFSLHKRKISFKSILVHRTLMICPKCELKK